MNRTSFTSGHQSQIRILIIHVHADMLFSQSRQLFVALCPILWCLTAASIWPIEVLAGTQEHSIAQASATEPAPSTPSNTTAAGEKIVYWQVGVTVTPTTWPVRGGVVRIPIPSQWPEQKVFLLSEAPGTGLKYEEKVLEGGLHILEVDIPALAKGEKAEMLLTYQVILTPIPAPEHTQDLTKPPKTTRELAPYLRSSPLIDPRHSSIKKLAAELSEGQAGDWAIVEAIHDWVINNIEMSAEPPAGSVKALANRKGHREDRINLFVALCRYLKVPARTVWASGMEYAEFYLENSSGEGRWYPCKLSGPREFGSLANPVLIEQKGEDFTLPGSNEKRRFVNATAAVSTVRNARGNPDRPSIDFVRRPVAQPPVE